MSQPFHDQAGDPHHHNGDGGPGSEHSVFVAERDFSGYTHFLVAGWPTQPPWVAGLFPSSNNIEVKYIEV